MKSNAAFQKINILTSADIANLVTMHEAVDAMEAAFASFSEGSSQVPQRTISAFDGLNLFLKPAYNKKLGRIAVKIITQKKEGSLNGIPAILGVVLLIDATTGAVISMLDGAAITAIRTGAAGGVAAKWLAKKNADTVAIIGCGTQGKAQLEAVCSVRPIKRALLFDLHPETAFQLKREVESKAQISVEVVSDKKRLKEAAVICTATQASRPLFKFDHIAAGTHINAIGSYQPNMQEIDPAILKSGRLLVDSRESVLKESGDLIKPIKARIFTKTVIDAEIGEMILHRTAGRTDADEITIFKSVGLGVQDLFLAHRIYENFIKHEKTPR